jgi:hypothetical protein
MKTFLRLLPVLFLICTIFTNAQPLVKPIKGTFLNFEYQDERNKYMSPDGIDGTSPELWHQKIQELSEMGIEYVILIFVANEGRAFYPSEFMPPAYPSGKESPVEAVLRAAEKFHIKVFMSSGWAHSDNDNSKKASIRAIQQKIMKETAHLFLHYRSFYGWYLPCEDMLGPFLSQEAVEAVNDLAAEAKRLTPNAKILISPYGLRWVDFSKKDFENQIAKLKVDIIAYQDQVGCLTDPLSMVKMKEVFQHLRPVHDRNKIALWANNEAFTWEKGINDTASALIPAPIPRLISQMAGVSKAGVDQLISFSFQGLLDKPFSKIPMGQADFSQTAYQDYMDWKNGIGKWPLLTKTFNGNLRHKGISSSVVINIPASEPYVKGDLTDGKLATENYEDPNWLGFEKKDLIITLDLGKKYHINQLAARFLTYKPRNIYLPSMVEFLASVDGKTFKFLKTVNLKNDLNDRYDAWIDLAFADHLNTEARFIRVYAVNALAQWIFTDEIFVNPEF